MPFHKNTLISLLPRSIQSRIKGLRVEHKQILRGMFVVGGFVLIGKFAGAAKEVVIAWRYGVSETVDAYLFVLYLVQYPVNILGGVIGSVLVPLAITLQHDSPQALSKFRAELWGFCLWTACGIGLVAWYVLPWLVQQPWVGLTVETAGIAEHMASNLAWILPFCLISRLLAAWTMAANRHLNTLLEAVPAISILIAVLITGGPTPLVWGTILGFMVQALLLYLPIVYRGETEWPRLTFTSSHWQVFSTSIGIMLVGQALMSSVGLVDQFFAAKLGSGALSTLGYANRILSLILGLGTIAISRAILPVFARAYSKDTKMMLDVVKVWVVLLGVVGFGAAVAGIILAPVVVELVFQRGAFTVENSLSVTEILRFSMVQIPFYLVSITLAYTLLSQRRHSAMLVIAGSSLFVKMTLALILIPFMGLKGVVLSTTFVYLCSSLLACWMLLKDSLFRKEIT